MEGSDWVPVSWVALPSGMWSLVCQVRLYNMLKMLGDLSSFTAACGGGGGGGGIPVGGNKPVGETTEGKVNVKTGGSFVLVLGQSSRVLYKNLQSVGHPVEHGL